MECREVKLRVGRAGKNPPKPEERREVAEHVSECPACAGDPRIAEFLSSPSAPDAPPAEERQLSRWDALIRFLRLATARGMALAAMASLLFFGAEASSWPQALRDEGPVLAFREEDDEDVRERDAPTDDLAKVLAIARRAMDADLNDPEALGELSREIRAGKELAILRKLREAGGNDRGLLVALEACLLRIAAAGEDAREWRVGRNLMARLRLIQALGEMNGRMD